MKFLKDIDSYINEQVLTSKRLYHGTVFKFDKFQDKITFFSPTMRFAYNYAARKSAENELDADIHVHTCVFNGNIFDATIKEELDKVAHFLPSEIEIYGSYNTAMISKEEILLNMQGFYTEEVPREVSEMKVGENIFYRGRTIRLIKEDTNYFYYIDQRSYSDAYNDLLYGEYSMDDFRSSKSKYKDSFLYGKYYETIYRIVYPNAKMESKMDKYDMKDRFQKVMLTARVNKKEIESNLELNNILSKIDSEIMKHINIDKINKKPEVVEFKNNWSRFENPTVIEAIEKAGFDGYIAYEDGDPTYAIFKPLETIKIID